MKAKYIVIPFEKGSLEEDGTFKGMASPFGGKADSYGDIIAAGAFTDTLKKGGRNGNGVAMLWQHNSEEPIGIWEGLTETDRGLEVQGKLALGVQKADEAHKLMKLGALKGLSIGYDFFRDKNNRPVDGSYERDDKGNTILKKLNLWEISPVTFPAQVRARITRVKSLEDAVDIREIEETLRDLGLSSKEAQIVISKIKSFERFKTDEENKKQRLDGLLSSLKQVNSDLGSLKK